MKPILLFSICIFFLYASTKAQQGPFDGTTFTTSAIGGSSQGWVNGTDAATSNDTYATFGNLPNPSGTYTDYLVVTGFSFSIPSNSSVTGIVVEVERSDPNGLTSDYSVRIVKNAVVGATERASGGAYPTTDAYQSYGGISDLWGETWSYKEITNANFGVAIAAQRNAAGGTTDGRIDHVRITIYYQLLVTLPVKLISFNASKVNNTVQLKWTTEEESGIDHYESERSINGRDFISIGEVTSRNSNSLTSYIYNDNVPSKGVSWYRLKIVSQSGTSKNSSIVSIRFDETKQHYLYPSLLPAGQTLYITNGRNEKLKIRFFNNAGQNVATTSTSDGQIPATPSLKNAGTYYYKIFDSKNIITGSRKIILQ